MGIFKDERVDYLEEERRKLWTQVTSIQEQLRGFQEDSRVVREQLRLLEEALAKKTSDYEAEAKQSAKKSVEYKNKSETAKEAATQNLININKILDEINNAHKSINDINIQAAELVDATVSAKNKASEACDSIKERQEHIEESILELERLFANSANYADNIKTLQILATNGQDTATKIDALYKYLLNKKMK
ncbi:hypothetical protein [Geobacter anodireducens]|uniref:Chromosome partition protein Smc n=1 Tax=Geobacter anodireducens TaxID=1340425 RepID=A0ABR9NZJ2_9BACT|nr:hypothetical protein [Geobacter anodireducens]MBE2889667.1 hypothetical protein [Geobacter anodireducens]